MDEEPIINKIYKGYVTGIRDYGAFIALEGLKGRREGLVHKSQIFLDNRRIHNINDHLKRGQRVYVKVKTYVNRRIGLSMAEVDQETGEDRIPATQYDPRYDDSDLKSYNTTNDDEFLFDEKNRRAKKRISSPERYEWLQLAKSGVIKLEDLPDYDEEHGLLTEDDEDNIDTEIELNDEKPIFLRDKLSLTGQVSPAKITQNLEGSLQRAAITQSALTKERRELREKQRNELLNSLPNDEMMFLREDPMTDPKQIQDLLNIATGYQPQELPEWKKIAFGRVAKLSLSSSKSIKEQRESLPIFQFREKLLQAVYANNVIIVVGETGSGKTTQITQYLAEAGYASKGKIGCTQPRRVAATSVARRVAEEVGCVLGEYVGYSIRFEDLTSPETKIKYMTDGMLLRECLLDPDLTQYSAIILDEAHERNIHTDVLMGLMKQTLLRRKDLKLIVTSATLDADKFSNYFYQCPIFTIPGREHPVEILYSKEPETDYLEAALLTVMQIHFKEPPGDILLFLTGQEEIDTACEILYSRMKEIGPDVPELIVLPIYSSLPSEMQAKIFEPAPPGARKCIIGTNIAETSVTIDGIYYVIDPGFVKQKVYNPKTGMDALVVCPISKAQAKQRAGRAGRTGPGVCYRLYTESAYQNEMLESPLPEIQRTNLANTVLTMKALGINDILNFDFMDKPAESQLVAAMHTLYMLNALDEEGLLTKIGRKMAEFPLEPQLAKVLLTSTELGCSEEILTIVAMLSVQNIFYRPRDKMQQADQKRAKFFQPEGDHLTLLCIYETWKKARYSQSWCYENFIQSRALQRARDVRKQLLQMMDKYKLNVVSCGRKFSQVRKAIVSGFFTNAAKINGQDGYRTLVEGTPVYMHPSSSLFQKNPTWVIYHELVQTTKEYMREVMAIEPKWLVEFAPNFYKLADPTKLTTRKRKERLEPLYDKYRDPNAWRLTKRRG